MHKVSKLSWKEYWTANLYPDVFVGYGCKLQYCKELNLIYVHFFAQGDSKLSADGRKLFKLPDDIAKLVKSTTRISGGTMTKADKTALPVYLEFKPDGYAYLVTVVGDDGIYRLTFDTVFTADTLN